MTKDEIIKILDRYFDLSAYERNGVNTAIFEKVASEILVLQPADADIEAWVLNSIVPHEDYIKLHTVDVARTCLVIGAKAMRDGEIKHIDNG